MLVDTGAGEFFGPGFGGKLLSSLASVGVTPDQITDILLTHAHDDHMGGLVHGGKLKFPNATVHMGKPDLDFFMNRENPRQAGYAMSYFDQASKALEPCLKAGKIKTFAGTEEVLPGVIAELHPGHTPGSAFLHAQESWTGDRLRRRHPSCCLSPSSRSRDHHHI